MPVEELKSDHDFIRRIKHSGDTLLVFDFYADWCGPCRKIAPFLYELSKHEKGVIFIKVNIEKFDDLADREGVTSLPTFIFYKNGRKINEIVGASRDKLVAAISTAQEDY